MTQAGTAQRLAVRIRWLGSPDPTWTEQDGRPTTQWAVTQALAFLEGMEHVGLLEQTEPQVTATARGGIEFVWRPVPDAEISVMVPAEPRSPLEVARTWRRPDGSVAEDEQADGSIDDAFAVAMSWHA